MTREDEDIVRVQLETYSCLGKDPANGRAQYSFQFDNLYSVWVIDCYLVQFSFLSNHSACHVMP